MQVSIDTTGADVRLVVTVAQPIPPSLPWGLRVDDSLFFDMTRTERDGHQDWEDESDETYFRTSRTLPGPWGLDVAVTWCSRIGRALAILLDEKTLKGQPTNKADPPPYPIDWLLDGHPMASVDAIQAKLLERPDVVYELGTFALEGRELRVTDPCYEKSTCCSGTTPALPGTWHAQSVVGHTDWHMRVKALRIRHESVAADVFGRLPEFVELDIHAGVDSGQCGFFDEGKYPVDAKSFEYEEGTFYGDCCDKTLSKSLPGGGVIAAGFGVVTSSGFGDGGYPVKALKNEQGEVIAAVLVFISNDDDDVDEDEAAESTVNA